MPTYEITASNGHKYTIEGADDKQAEEIGDWIEDRIAAGDTELNDTSNAPHKAQFVKAPVADVPMTPEGQIDRGGLLTGLDALIRGGARAVTGGMADEFAAALNTVGNFGQQAPMDFNDTYRTLYEKNLELQRGIDIADDTQHPGMVGLGKGAGAAAQAILALRGLGATGAAPALEAAAIARPMTTAAVASGVGGAVQGGLSGFGEGTDMASRDKNARMGAAVGGGLGAILGPAATGLAPAIARYGSVLFGNGADKEATRQLIQALQRDGYDVTSPSGVQALKTELGRYLGKPVSLADIGNATRARAGVGLRAPSDVQSQSIDNVMARQAGQGQRLASDITQNVAPRTDVHALDSALVEQRDAAALPLREKALFEQGPGYGNPALPKQPLIAPTGEVEAAAPDAGLRRMLGLEAPESLPTYQPISPDSTALTTARQARIPEDPQLQQLARLPLAQRALQSARGIASSERDLLAATGQPFDHLPDVNTSGANLDMRTMDYMKRFLDRQVNTLARGQNTDTFRSEEFQAVKDLRNALRERMRSTVPEYGAYLDAYSGSSDLIDDLAAGRDFTKLDPEQIASEQAGRSTAGQELYRVGVARDLSDTVRSTTDGRNPAARLLNSPEARDQLAATGVAPESAARLNQAVGIERQLSRLPAELAGSQTANRTAAAVDADAGAHAALPFNPGSPFGWLGAGARTVLNRASTTRNAAVNESLLPRLLETDPAAISKTIDDLERQGQYAQAAQLRKMWITTLVSSGLGNRLGTEGSVNPGGN